ncbi:MAG: S8 family peptidase [Bryobacteraceae bacterium]
MNYSHDDAIIRSAIAEPLRSKVHADAAATYAVIFDLNIEYVDGREAAADRVRALLEQAARESAGDSGAIHERKSAQSRRYLYGRLSGSAIRRLAELDASRPRKQRAIHRIWLDFEVRSLLTRSRSTVKADAAQRSFSALGEGIVWAVLDTGIDGTHPHFALHGNLLVDAPLRHMDFTADSPAAVQTLGDSSGHGTHVAGILAGEYEGEGDSAALAMQRQRGDDGEVQHVRTEVRAVAGMAPRAKLLSLRVLDDSGLGVVSNVLAALDYIEQVNDHGRRLLIHGVNLSVGYDFDPEWFACGQTPLCAQVNRLVRTGVVVVAAAGNSGGGFTPSITDPGNADLASTVGATHAEMPHVYGVSYFSSKGPTGDGRAKPDLIAPGENVLSCGRDECSPARAVYVERSGTSMAAPHVSGAIAAFLSVRREFIGQPEAVKRIFTSTATDLGRERHFQGHGLLDLMRAIQSV